MEFLVSKNDYMRLTPYKREKWHVGFDGFEAEDMAGENELRKLLDALGEVGRITKWNMDAKLPPYIKVGGSIYIPIDLFNVERSFLSPKNRVAITEKGVTVPAFDCRNDPPSLARFAAALRRAWIRLEM